MRTTKWSVGLAALTGGLLAAAGCGGEDDAARRQAGPAIAPPGAGAQAPAASGANAAPRIASVRFDPAQPGAGGSVRALVDAADPDGDGIRLGYVWSVDGENLAAGGAKIDLPAKYRRGAGLEVRVTASDGRAESEAFVARTAIGNRAPRLSGLTIQPAGRITAAGPITALASAVDPDGDAVEYAFTWRINGATADEAGPMLAAERLKRGDFVSVEVVASDGDAESEPLASPLIEVVNAAPVFRSEPKIAADGVSFRYQVVAEDADGDRLRYGLASAPEGMTVLAMSGEVDWTPLAEQAGTHPVEIWVEDPQGARTTQRFELTIGAPPEEPKGPAAPLED